MAIVLVAATIAGSILANAALGSGFGGHPNPTATTTAPPATAPPTTAPPTTAATPPAAGRTSPTATPTTGGGTPDPKDFELVEGQVVRWDACGPIRWRLRRGPGPADAQAIAQRAVDQLAAATGLRFEYAGETSELPTSPSSEVPDRTITIGWATPKEVPDLGGSVAGLGGPRYRGTDPQHLRPVSGFALVDASEQLARGFDGGASEGAVLLHELGHVMGLAHSTDEHRIMYPATVPSLKAAYQPGDLAALATAFDPRPCG